MAHYHMLQLKQKYVNQYYKDIHKKQDKDRQGYTTANTDIRGKAESSSQCTQENPSENI